MTLLEATMILVLGAGGHVGAPVVESLAARGARFRAGHRSPERVDAARRDGIEAMQVDYRDAGSLDRAMAGVERVFLLGPPAADLEVLEQAGIEAARRAGVRHLVKLSAWDAHSGDFLFGRPHRAGEQRIERSGLAWTFLRPNGFMQNLLTSAQVIREAGVYPFLRGGSVSWIDARDVGRAAAAVLTGNGHEGRAYDLSGPEALDYAGMIRILGEVTGRPLSYLPLPDAEWREAALGYGLPAFVVDGLIDLHRFQRSGVGARVTDAVERLTGSPPTPFRRFAEDHVHLFR